MKLNQLQRNALNVLRARLDARDTGFRGDKAVYEALNGPARIYIDSWVLPLLDVIATGKEQWFDQSRQIAHDSASIDQQRRDPEKQDYFRRARAA